MLSSAPPDRPDLLQPANGDCFYLAVTKALSSADRETSIKALRAHVASQLDEETFQLYRDMHGAGVEGTILTPLSPSPEPDPAP